MVVPEIDFMLACFQAPELVQCRDESIFSRSYPGRYATLRVFIGFQEILILALA